MNKVIMNKFGAAIITAAGLMYCAYQAGSLKGYTEGYDIGWETGKIQGLTTCLEEIKKCKVKKQI